MWRKLLAALVLAAGPSGCLGGGVRLDAAAPATWATEPGGYEEATVTRVVDGDTVEVRITDRVPGPGAGQTRIGETYPVRLIGIDTPESVKPGSPIECFGREASAAAEALLGGRQVRLVVDVDNTDRYDRLLRYIYMSWDDGKHQERWDEMANARLVVNGYAFAYTYPPDVRHADLFVALQRDARRAGRGLWTPGAC